MKKICVPFGLLAGGIKLYTLCAWSKLKWKSCVWIFIRIST